MGARYREGGHGGNQTGSLSASFGEWKSLLRVSHPGGARATQAVVFAGSWFEPVHVAALAVGIAEIGRRAIQVTRRIYR